MDLLVKEPYVRMFIPNAGAKQFLKTLTTTFNGQVDFDFYHEPSGSTVYAVATNVGRFSVVATD